MGKVTGTVTLDGVPLSGAQVTFEPKQGGVTSTDRTNDKGEFNLVHAANSFGAVVGEHTVRITTQDAETPAEKLPAIYNEKSTLTATVAPGNNALPFALESKPKPEKK